MARHNASPARQSPRRSPRRSSPPPRRSSPPPPPRCSPEPAPAGEVRPLFPAQPRGQDVEVAVEAYNQPSSRKINIMRAQCGALYFRTVPNQFSPFVNPFVNDAIWSFTPRSGVTRTSTLGRKVGDIHWSFLGGGRDATFYVCVANQNRLKWVTVERGNPHPLYPTHVLYQREKSAPRWILARTFRAYIRMHGRRFTLAT
ncbi:hypothetical protein FS749_012312 [Ceratobasidium sp. UAMH 11750]|nr:hypothetical protein FS749_012312 [Ceratobasidium sp. UAMH 11750]